VRYYKIVENDVLTRIGIGEGGEQISKSEYNLLIEELKQIPFEIPLSALEVDT
jgi:hypothetical protein